MISAARPGLFSRLVNRWKQLPASVRIFWLLCAVSLPIWAHFDDTAWDFNVYAHALTSLKQGHDPYLEATNLQKLHHQTLSAAEQRTVQLAPPYSYVYAPVTLPVLRTLGVLPGHLLSALYVLIYLVGAVAAVAVAATFAEKEERSGVLYLAAVALFFPGLLANGVILSGNVAYIFYGAVFAGAYFGWHRNRWLPFYLAVLVAACVKAPLLSLVLIAPLSGRKQWLPACGVITSFFAVYGLQPLLAPALFHHYLEAVELQFSFNQDFGCGPAGLYSQYLFHRGLPYAPGCYIAYLAYAAPVFAALLYGARRHAEGRITLEQWAPVLFTGIVLLNPRIMEYDSAPLMLPMALILWRMARLTRLRSLAFSLLAIVFLALNVLSIYSWLVRKAIDGPLILLTFCAGCFLVQREVKAAASSRELQPDQFAAA